MSAKSTKGNVEKIHWEKGAGGKNTGIIKRERKGTYKVKMKLNDGQVNVQAEIRRLIRLY